MISIDAIFERIERAGIEAGMAAITRGAEKIADRARDKAPVRKVFEGQDDRYRVRLKSIEEIEADRDVRRTLGLGPERTHLYPPTIVSRRAPRLLELRPTAGPGALKSAAAQDRLDRRGRYELKTGRAVHGRELGGRLRREIYAEEARLEGRMIVARVVSPTPYAKFQELGTRHNPAHPYLRPAGHESADEIRADTGRSIATAAQAAVPSGTRVGTITYHLKAG